MFDVTKDVRLSCSVSPPLFNVYTEEIFREIKFQRSQGLLWWSENWWTDYHAQT